MIAPKLRFKDFDQDWTLTTLNQLSTKIGDGIHATPKYDESGTIPFINGNNLINGRIAINENTKRISSEEFQKYNQILSDRSLFLSINGTIGNLAFYKNEKVLLGKSVCFINLKNDLDKKFIYLLLQSPQLTKTLNSELTGTTIKNLSLATVRNSEFYCPIEAEQTKIASFLSAVDEKINQLTQKHELLSQYKQGMMQKLFIQQIRFKADDGSEFGEWGINIIRDVFTNKSKNFNPQNEGNLPCIELEHLSQNTGKILGTIESCEQQSTKNLFEKNSVLFGKLRPYLRKFAKPKFKGVCSSEIWVLTGIKVSNDYLFQYIQSEQFSELTNIQSGSKMPRADWGVISEAEIEYPCLAEQTKIANFLSAIDQKIEVVAQQIEQAKIWKKGLLQQMFV